MAEKRSSAAIKSYHKRQRTANPKAVGVRTLKAINALHTVFFKLSEWKIWCSAAALLSISKLISPIAKIHDLWNRFWRLNQNAYPLLQHLSVGDEFAFKWKHFLPLEKGLSATRLRFDYIETRRHLQLPRTGDITKELRNFCDGCITIAHYEGRETCIDQELVKVEITYRKPNNVTIQLKYINATVLTTELFFHRETGWRMLPISSSPWGVRANPLDLWLSSQRRYMTGGREALLELLGDQLF
jgi:hypothetical protein